MTSEFAHSLKPRRLHAVVLNFNRATVDLHLRGIDQLPGAFFLAVLLRLEIENDDAERVIERAAPA